MKRITRLTSFFALILLLGLTGCGSSVDEKWDTDIFFNYEIDLDTGQDSLDVVGYVNKIVDRRSWFFFSHRGEETLLPQNDCRLVVYGNVLHSSNPEGVYHSRDWEGDIFSANDFEVSLSTPENKNFSFSGHFFNVLTERIEYPDTIQVGQALSVLPVIGDSRAHVYLAKLVGDEEVWIADAEDYQVPEDLAGQHLRFVSVMFVHSGDSYFDERNYNENASCSFQHNYYLRKNVYVAP